MYGIDCGFKIIWKSQDLLITINRVIINLQRKWTMYNRFKTGLLKPSEIGKYFKDSWLRVWAYFFMLVLIQILPFTVFVMVQDGLSVDEYQTIESSFREHLSGNHSIQNGLLMIPSESLNEPRYFVMDAYTIGIINTPSQQLSGLNITFIDEGVRFSVSTLYRKYYSYESLGLHDFEFNDYSTLNVQKFMRAINTIVKDNQVFSKGFSLGVFIASTVIELLFISFLASSFTFTIIPFKVRYKIAVYVSTVYVIGSLFALVLYTSLIQLIGMIAVIVYMRIALSKLMVL